MEKQEFEELENPPEGWHLEACIKPCSAKNTDGTICEKVTEFMYPIFGKFVCEVHRGGIMFMKLCCSNCFEPYWPSFPERTNDGKDKWTGHCNGRRGCCHDRDSELRAMWQATPEYKKQHAEEKEKRIKYNIDHAEEIRDEYVIGHVEFDECGGYFGQNVVYGKIDGSATHTAHDGSGYLEPMTLRDVKKRRGEYKNRGGMHKIYKLVEIKIDD